MRDDGESPSRGGARTTRTRALSTVAALALGLHGPSALATPPFAAAARLLPPAAQRELLGGEPAPALVVQGGVPRWTALAPAAIDASRLPRGALSLGATLVPALDRSVDLVGAATVRTTYGLTGRGVVVAVVDTGVDVRHGDFRNADGTTRVAWLLDYARAPRGAHPALEARFAIGDRGAVWSSRDLDAALREGADVPGDEVGHGTYVASIAAGNGRATGRYAGVAPEAALVVVRATGDGQRAVTAAALVAGVTFALDRADAAGAPAVVNLSLGTHAGSHDGASALERALAGLFPEDRAGRALVASAGNDGDRAVHARLALAPGATRALPLDVGGASREGPSDVVGVEVVCEGRVAVAVRWPDGRETPFVPVGRAEAFATDAGVASVANATDGADPDRGTRVASVLLAGGAGVGRARAGGEYALLLRGDGRVDAWIALDGSRPGRPRFTRWARADGTVTAPATAPWAVAVGALSTRAAPASVAAFSGRGPGRLGALRPDLVAPGDAVVAARSAQARGALADLAAVGRAADDEAHVAGRGSSAAAPHAAGALALLLEAAPTLTRRDLAAALAGGARPVGATARWDAAAGWGALDVDRALALVRGAAGAGVDPTRSEVTAGARALAPDEGTDVAVRLADARGEAVTESVTVSLRATGGDVGALRDEGGGRRVARFTARGVAPGARVVLAASAGGVALAPLEVVVVDDTRAGAGATASGGCAVAAGGRGGGGLAAVLVSALLRGAARRSRWRWAGRRGRGLPRRGP